MIESWRDAGKRYSLIKSSCVYVVHKHKHVRAGEGGISVYAYIIGVNLSPSSLISCSCFS